MTIDLGDPATTLEWSCVLARGAESESFLQGQLSQDLAVVDEEGTWSALLAPDSVVVTSCWVRRVCDGFDLTVPAELGVQALGRLQRFVLRAKCSLDLVIAKDGPFRSDGERVRVAWPGPAEFAASLSPHSFGRHFVDSTMSFTKGCFTGQELVGRLDARGSSVPWRMVTVEGNARDELDDILKSKGPDGPQGVTSAVRRDGRVEGLGFAHRTLWGAAPWSADVTITEVP